MKTELAAGERVRGQARTAIFAALALASVFAVWTWASKENVTLNACQPWQDDPFDVMVSLDFVILPLLVAMGAARVQLCRRDQVLPTRRLVDVLRVCSAAIGVSLATELSQWVAVALGLHGSEWTAITTWQVVVLAALTSATLVAVTLLWRSSRAVGRVAEAGAQPDWLTDAPGFGLLLARRLGRHGGWAQTAIRWTDERVADRVRRHPVAAAALLAAILALPFPVSKALFEGYPTALVLLSFAFPATGLFVFTVVVGRYLRVVAPRPEGMPPALPSAVVACAAGTVAFAFHDSLLTHQTPATLGALFFGAIAAAGAVSITIHLALRRYHAPGKPGRPSS
jgi:hypothetical protein